MHPSLLDALDSVAEWKAGGSHASVRDPAQPSQGAEKSEAELVRQNTKALAEIAAMMPGGLRL